MARAESPCFGPTTCTSPGSSAGVSLRSFAATLAELLPDGTTPEGRSQSPHQPGTDGGAVMCGIAGTYWYGSEPIAMRPAV